MLKEIKPSGWTSTEYYQLVYDDGEGNGFVFPCDKAGNEDPDMNEAAKQNLAWCRLNPRKFKRAGVVQKMKNEWREPDQGVCECGATVFLENQYMGACQCPGCGQWYNLSGQELLPPDEWGWDGTPFEEEW